jgi:hypothetical protein
MGLIWYSHSLIHASLRYQPVQHCKRNCFRGAAFKASSHQLGSAMRRTARSSMLTVTHQNGLRGTITIGVPTFALLDAFI